MEAQENKKMNKFTYHLAKFDLAFLVGLSTLDTPQHSGFKVKVKRGQPCILYDNHNVISIINPEDSESYDNLYAINTTAIGGFDGVFADSQGEALDLLADWCQRYAPGLIQTWEEAVSCSDGNEEWANEYYGPVGNECLFFTELGQGPIVKEVNREI